MNAAAYKFDDRTESFYLEAISLLVVWRALHEGVSRRAGAITSSTEEAASLGAIDWVCTGNLNLCGAPTDRVNPCRR